MFFHNFNASKNAMNRKGEMMKGSRRHKIYILFPSGCVCVWESANSNSFWQCASEAATGISQQKYNEIYTTWQFMVFFPLFIFFLAHFIIISHIHYLEIGVKYCIAYFPIVFSHHFWNIRSFAHIIITKLNYVPLHIISFILSYYYY